MDEWIARVPRGKGSEGRSREGECAIPLTTVQALQFPTRACNHQCFNG